MTAARGGLNPVQDRLQFIKISPFTPVEVYTWFTLGPMAEARGGIKPVQGRLHLSKISDFTPVFSVLSRREAS